MILVDKIRRIPIDYKAKKRIKLCGIILAVVTAIAFAVFTVMKYDVEGERNVPFRIGKVIVISSAATTDGTVVEENVEETNANEGENVEVPEVTPAPENQEENYIWNEKVVQTNDIYIYLDKDSNYKKDEIIKSVKIDNIKILENVKLGKVQVYMPNSLNDGLYKYVNDYLVNSSLTYKGSVNDNVKALEIGNQGGCICISFANVGLGSYKSNEAQEIEQGGTILAQMNIANEDLKFKVTFDVVIESEEKTYKTNITLDLPINELVGQKETHVEITDFSNNKYKRL
ncbi:MAG: hypothetical protein K6B70_07075 [Clostridia bacterium]|nr:hypothetical protein [Clostridia bacterium]